MKHRYETNGEVYLHKGKALMALSDLRGIYPEGKDFKVVAGRSSNGEPGFRIIWKVSVIEK